MADIFVSYTSSDREWTFWIGQQLERLGHTPHIHDWEISAGGDIAAWMEERHDKADNVLLVVSEAYLTKSYSRWERLAAQWAAAKARPNFALPVLIEDCKLPTLLAQIKRCELHGIDEEEHARARLTEYLIPAAKPHEARRLPAQGKGCESAIIRRGHSISGRKARALEHPDHRSPPFPRPRRRACGDRRRAEGRQGPGRGRGAAWPARGRQDDARGGLRRAPSGPTIARPGGSGRRRNRRCAPISFRSACASAGSPPTRRRSPRSKRFASGCGTRARGCCSSTTMRSTRRACRPYLPTGGAARALVTSNAHAWRGVADASRNPRLAEGGRRGLSHRPHRARQGARGGRGAVGGARRPDARA